MKRRKLLILGLIGVFSIAALSGCSNKETEVKYDVEGESESNKEMANDTIEEASYWEESFVVEMANGDSKKITIDAEIEAIPKNERVVIEAKETAKDKEAVIRKYFPNGTIYDCQEENASQLYCEAMMQFYDREVSRLDENNLGVDDLVADRKGDEYGNIYRKYEEKVDSASEKLTEAISFEGTDYYVIENGIEYLVRFEKSLDENGESYTNFVHISRADVREVCPKSLRNRRYLYYDKKERNKRNMIEECTIDNGQDDTEITEEAAKEKAQDALRKLGISNGILQDVSVLEWAGLTEKNPEKNEKLTIEFISCGYIFTYKIGVGNQGAGVSYCDSYVYISVGNSGVIEIGYINPIEIVNVTKDVTQLSLEQVQDIMIEEIKSNPANYTTEKNLNCVNT